MVVVAFAGGDGADSDGMDKMEFASGTLDDLDDDGDDEYRNEDGMLFADSDGTVDEEQDAMESMRYDFGMPWCTCVRVCACVQRVPTVRRVMLQVMFTCAYLCTYPMSVLPPRVYCVWWCSHVKVRGAFGCVCVPSCLRLCS